MLVVDFFDFNSKNLLQLEVKLKSILLSSDCINIPGLYFNLYIISLPFQGKLLDFFKCKYNTKSNYTYYKKKNILNIKNINNDRTFTNFVQ